MAIFLHFTPLVLRNLIDTCCNFILPLKKPQNKEYSINVSTPPLPLSHILVNKSLLYHSLAREMGVRGANNINQKEVSFSSLAAFNFNFCAKIN